ncbi:hypothetical protein FB45DRAFT_759128 [Roridomyces roridus]|uniref:SMAD/FHA domain-containing protein n=1 Tax=Roridomyces roridus TaxID=1738132 RepID=A0AAD7FE68_9AGAR|nr:hypothetical protein FB45DRAFT_759128 [Roridomyces roridus]
MLRRRRSAGNVASAAPTPIVIPAQPMLRATTNANANQPATGTGTGTGTSHRIRLVPHLESRRSLRFDAIARDLRAGDTALRIGRFTDRSGMGLAAVNALNTNKIAFKSKVVSRAHAEIWVEQDGGADAVKFFIRDTKSSSGTFLNHVRLSAANTESRPHQVKDGDILQLGVDYQGGAEDIYKSVKIRVELGREWQAAANAFNTTALKNLKALAVGATGASSQPKAKRKALGGGSIPDCCICLFPVSIRQALFIAPCSHTFHYKCLRPLLEAHHPAFSCPLCRTFADLEEDVEVDVEEEEEVSDSCFWFSNVSCSPSRYAPVRTRRCLPRRGRAFCLSVAHPLDLRDSLPVLRYSQCHHLHRPLLTSILSQDVEIVIDAPPTAAAAAHHGDEDEGVLADDLADVDEEGYGYDVDEMYAAPPRIRVDGGMDTEVEDNAGGAMR